MSYYEAEKFETTDYDLELESTINSSTRRFTKHQQTHGIWADESRGEGGGGPSSSASFRGAVDGKRYGYTAPVRFVSGGIQQAGRVSRTGFGSQRWRDADVATSRLIQSAPVSFVSAGTLQAGKDSRTGFGSERGRGADMAKTARFIEYAPANWFSAGIQQTGEDSWTGFGSERGRGADIATASRLIQSAPVGMVSDDIQELGKESRTVRLVSAGMQLEDEDSWADFDSHRWRGASTSSDGHEGSGLEFRQHSQLNSFVAGDIAGLRTKQTSAVSSSLMQRGFNSWEKPKKEVGAKIMFKMGFRQGKGLGKDLQGITAPIDHHVRHGRGTIGAYGPEKVMNQQQPIEIVDSDEDEEIKCGMKSEKVGQIKPLSGAQKRKLLREQIEKEGKEWIPKSIWREMKGLYPKGYKKRLLPDERGEQIPSTSAAGNKRTRVDLDTPSPQASQIQKMPKREIGKQTYTGSGSVFRIAVIQQGYPLVGISSQQEQLVEAALFEKIGAHTSQSPKFQRVYLDKGALIFVCQGRETVEWLENMVPQIYPWEEAKLLVKTEAELFKTATISIRVPKLLKDFPPKTLLEKVRAQNPNVSTDDWKVINRKVETNGQILVVEVGEKSLKALREQDLKLFLGFSKVSVRVIVDIGSKLGTVSVADKSAAQ